MYSSRSLRSFSSCSIVLFTTSPMLTRPTRAPPSVTGRWRMRWLVMVVITAPTSASGVLVWTGVDMMSRTRRSSRPPWSWSSRRTMSRSETMPSMWTPSDDTTRAPIPCSASALTASRTAASGAMAATSDPLVARMSAMRIRASSGGGSWGRQPPGPIVRTRVVTPPPPLSDLLDPGEHDALTQAPHGEPGLALRHHRGEGLPGGVDPHRQRFGLRPGIAEERHAGALHLLERREVAVHDDDGVVVAEQVTELGGQVLVDVDVGKCKVAHRRLSDGRSYGPPARAPQDLVPLRAPPPAGDNGDGRRGLASGPALDGEEHPGANRNVDRRGLGRALGPVLDALPAAGSWRARGRERGVRGLLRGGDARAPGSAGGAGGDDSYRLRLRPVRRTAGGGAVLAPALRPDHGIDRGRRRLRVLRPRRRVRQPARLHACAPRLVHGHADAGVVGGRGRNRLVRGAHLPRADRRAPRRGAARGVHRVRFPRWRRHTLERGRGGPHQGGGPGARDQERSGPSRRDRPAHRLPQQPRILLPPGDRDGARRA